MDMNAKNGVISINELLKYMRGKIIYIILTGTVCAVIALFYTMCFITPLYTSTTKMYVLNQESNNTITSSDLQSSTYLTEDYVEIATSRTVIESVIDLLELDTSYEDLQNSVEVTVADNTRVVKISVVNSDPYMARDIANAIRAAAAKQILIVMNIEAVNVVDEANLPTQKSSPDVCANVEKALAAGMLVAMAFFVLLFLLNDKVTTSEDVERYLELGVLGTVPLETDNSKKKRVGKQKRMRGHIQEK